MVAIQCHNASAHNYIYIAKYVICCATFTAL